MIYKSDVIEALESYLTFKKSRQEEFDIETFIKHYCRKFGYNYSKCRKLLYSIVNLYMEGKQ